MEQLNKFQTVNEQELEEVQGGVAPFVITGTMVLKGLAALGAGITVGKLLAGK